MRLFFIAYAFLCCSLLQAQKHLTAFEKSGRKKTASYEECTQWYRDLHTAYPECTFFDSIGLGDIGKPIYTFRIFCGNYDPKVRVLINNNIHPGEPEGTDASMLLVREILGDQKKYESVLREIDLYIICQYNVDGTLNRGTFRRANQDGPEEMGFRANSRNLDLNRDFIKMDSKNAQAFVKFFTSKKFHLLVDNHTSNGADYQYTLTYFHTRPEKLDSGLAGWLIPFEKKFSARLDKDKIIHSPYVETVKTVPDSGIMAFWETGRFATGFAALHHCVGYTVETHMLKPFDKRVDATYAFLKNFLLLTAEKEVNQPLLNARKRIEARAGNMSGKNIYTHYTLDRARADSFSFLGYAFGYKPSQVSGQPRLYYDRSKPFRKTIPYYCYYKPTDSVLLPRMYIIPTAWADIAEKLKKNGVEMKRSVFDTTIMLRISFIQSFETVKNPYEGHYLHYSVSTREVSRAVKIKKGDFLIEVTPENASFLAAVLEPRSPDSYFNWNFFDAVVQQKEWYSDYVWEDKAAEILAADTALKQLFEKAKANDPKLAASPGEQLTFIYKHSRYYEETHNLYPVYRLD